jgi:hypothetical protein
MEQRYSVLPGLRHMSQLTGRQRIIQILNPCGQDVTRGYIDSGNGATYSVG